MDHSRKAQFIHCDVYSWEEQIRMFEAAIGNSPSKSCDIVIANAGLAGPDSLSDVTGWPHEE